MPERDCAFRAILYWYVFFLLGGGTTHILMIALLCRRPLEASSKLYQYAGVERQAGRCLFEVAA